MEILTGFSFSEKRIKSPQVAGAISIGLTALTHSMPRSRGLAIRTEQYALASIGEPHRTAAFDDQGAGRVESEAVHRGPLGMQLSSLNFFANSASLKGPRTTATRSRTTLLDWDIFWLQRRANLVGSVVVWLRGDYHVSSGAGCQLYLTTLLIGWKTTFPRGDVDRPWLSLSTPLSWSNDGIVQSFFRACVVRVVTLSGICLVIHWRNYHAPFASPTLSDLVAVVAM